jgi:ABC-type lipoprotein release transport system permease subunit
MHDLRLGLCGLRHNPVFTIVAVTILALGSIVLLGVTLIAAIIPARRASRVDPSITLRGQ